jgi:asparagine synthase (glutamine-hydrolysing)
MLGTFNSETAELDISGESARLVTPAADVYLKGSCYLPEHEQLRLLSELASAGARDDLVRALPGQFVIVIHDKQHSKLALIRDHIGQQPLYYSTEGARLLFASSTKELRTLARRPWSFDVRALYDLLAIKYVQAPVTMFTEVSEQAGGTVLEFCNGKMQPARVFFDRIPRTPLADPGSDEQQVARFKSEFSRSFAATCADAQSRRFAILSSGGIDSSMLVGAWRKLTQAPVPTIYVGCEGYSNDKSKEAEFVGRLFGTEHRNVYVRGAEFAEQWQKTIAIADYPVSSPSTVLRSYLYSRLSGEIDVLLSGEGADSLYTGYYIYDLVYRFYTKATARPLLALLTRLLPLSMLPGERGRKARLVRRAMTSSPDEYLLHHDTLVCNNAERLSGMLESFDESDYLPLFKRELSGYGRADILNRIQGIYASSFLGENLAAIARFDDVYRLEHRHPFIDAPMLDAFNEVSWGRKVGSFRRKRLVVEMAKEYLPESFFNMPKEGFGVPIPEWFRDPASLGQFVDLLNSRAFRERGLFKKAYVDALLSDYQNDRMEHGSYERVLWPMLNFELWARHNLDGH